MLLRLVGSILLVSLVAFPARLLAQSLEIDGNAVTDSGPGLPEDWDALYQGTGSTAIFSFRAEGLATTSFFGPSNKDTDPVSTWRWADGAVPAKDNILDAFFARYGDEFYFGLDRYTGAGGLGFGLWLLQDSVGLNADSTFSGGHIPGDILIIAGFHDDGTPLATRVFEWVGDGSGSDGNLDSLALGGAMPVVQINPDTECSPWPYTDLLSTTCPGPCPDCFPAHSFAEGSVSLSALGTGCFRTLLMSTRSPGDVSVTAELKDFVLFDWFTAPPLEDVCNGQDLCTVLDAGYSYLWSTGATSHCLNAPGPGTYTVTITDPGNPCPVVRSATVFPGLTVAVPNACAGDSLCATVTGGQPPFTYSWSQGDTTSCTSPGLIPGVYRVTVTDVGGCIAIGRGTVLPGTLCDLVCVGFTAVLNMVDDPESLLAGSLSVGDTLTGTYIYDPTTTDTNGLPTVGDFWHTTGPYGIAISGGGLTFETDPSAVNFLMELVNDHGSPIEDNYLIRSYVNQADPLGNAVDLITWQLDDPQATALSGTEPPASPPDLLQWQSNFGLSIDGSAANSSYLLQATVIEVARCGQAVGIAPDEDTRRGPILSAHPNPFAAGTRIHFSLEQDSPVRVDVIAVNGRRTRVLQDGVLAAGPWDLQWDGRDDRGNRVPNGVYFIRLQTDTTARSFRVIHLR